MKHGNEVPEWARRSRKDYELEIKRMIEDNKTKSPHVNIRKVHDPRVKCEERQWESITHELVYVLGLLEEDPTSPKNWKKVFRVLRVYEEMVRRG